MNRKIKILFITSLIATIFSFSETTYAENPQVTNYKLNGKEESARFNPSSGGAVNIEVSANVPVKFNTIALCVTTDAVCNRNTAVKYFTQTDFSTSVSKEWDGKTSKGVIVSDGDYKIKVTMKDESEQENSQELSPYVISVDSNFSGGSGGNTSSVSQSSLSGSRSSSSSSTLTAGSVSTSYISVYSSSAQSSSASKYSNTLEINAGSDRLVYSDTPTDFSAEAGVPKGFSEQAVKYIWSFGDGSSAEGGKVSHVYKFAGDYIVVLNASLSNLTAVSRSNIKVISPSVYISNITNDWVEIANQGMYEINLKGWSILNNSGKFLFLADTIVGSNKKISVPNEYMKLNLLQAGKVSLLNPSGKETAYIPKISGENASLIASVKTSSASSLQTNPVIKKTREVATGGSQSSASNSAVSFSKKSSSGQAADASGAKNKQISVSENSEIVSSSAQVATAVSSLTPRRGFMRTLLDLPSAGFSFIKKAFYSEN